MAVPNKILEKMMERLLAALVNGPSLNCRPYASRQRLDVIQLGRLGDAKPEDVLRGLLDRSREVTIKARVPMPRGNGDDKPQKLKVAASIEAADEHGIPLADGPVEEESQAQEKTPERAWIEQQAVLNKLHTIAQDAHTYEQDTGVSVLHVGFPLLSLPPGTFGGGNSAATRRVLAPLAFIPVSITVRRGAAPAIELACNKEGNERVIGNDALIAWLEQQTGKPPVDVDDDEEGMHPWEEICAIVRGVCAAMDIPVPELFKAPPPADPDHGAGASSSSAVAPSPLTPDEGTTLDVSRDTGVPPVQASPATDKPKEPQQPAIKKPRICIAALDELELHPAPKSDETGDRPQILCSAVLGLFPMANQGLLRDMQTMIRTENLTGPVESFIRLGVSLDAPPVTTAQAGEAPPAPKESRPVVIAEERFVTGSDPCQARAVRLARECRGLVVHGPPGTGKSQTITNIIGDHLARGQRVLVVCDKRTALDVVYNRLSHMELGKLCALVHDPRRDHREMYKSIRRQLDELTEAKSDARAEGKLAKVDGELKEIHDELSRYRDALIRRPGEHSLNFHELVGEWLALAEFARSPVALEGASLQTLETYTNGVVEVLKRGEAVAFGVNPWASAAGIALGDFLAQPMDKIRSMTSLCEETARAADATINPIIPPFAAEIPLQQQAEARTTLADALPRVIASTEKAILARWARESADGLARAKRKMEEAGAFINTFREGPLDAELLANVPAEQPDMAHVASHLLKLAGYQDIAKKWYSFLPLRPKKEAGKVMNGHGLTLSPANAIRLQKFLNGLRARAKVSILARELLAQGAGYGSEARAAGTLPDEVLEQSLAAHTTVIELMRKVRTDAELTGLADRVAAVLMQPEAAPEFVNGLRLSPARAAALEKLEDTATRSRLFESKWFADASHAFRAGDAAFPIFSPLREKVETLEGVLRIRLGLGVLPVKLRGAVDGLLKASIEADRGVAILRREALVGEISARLQADPNLQNIDGHRLDIAFNRYRELDELKRKLTRAAILHRWTSRQQERLLVQTGSKLSSLGAALGRRLMLRGEKALRLRQVVATGADIEGGDPLFDVCPIWLCSPETVAQVFPLKPVFDVLVFDEASQMRLEESLPVLVRAKRVVIAGDPKQLPPTRFFESAVAASEDDEAESDQDLFEQQQGEIEDLLAAALGLDIQQCYLDVHYRSRHGDLIAFSNDHFYGSRLQPIPGHPANIAPDVPVELDHVGGTYERRRNEAEAGRIVEIVKDLLSRKDPPSIGIACFNIVQRDLIAEKLDDLAAEDLAFAKRLEKSRERQGEGSFEGLFIKNLENVQGDERDYILISTTYGPDPSGKFYRRFGPLGRSGGGRRLNVLVTRAREKVHIVTSIPRDAFGSLPELESGQAPGGTWLLLAYLKFADALKRAREGEVAQVDSGQDALVSEIDSARREPVVPSPKTQPVVNILSTKAPSHFAEALARRLAADHGVGSDVNWGNEGFCVDLALRHPTDPHPVTIGVLCDAARFAAADDPMQWDVFRTGILESQGWKLHRIWTPHFFRDPAGLTSAVVKESNQSFKP